MFINSSVHYDYGIEDIRFKSCGTTPIMIDSLPVNAAYLRTLSCIDSVDSTEIVSSATLIHQQQYLSSHSPCVN